MDDVYDVFKNHVKQIRGDRLKKPIDELAGGRVFTGKQALELGLVDKIGTLQDAIEHVASNAKLGEDYEVRVVPAPKNFLEKILEDASGGKEDPAHLTAAIAGCAMRAGAQRGSLVDLAMPYLQNLDPQRVAKIKAALQTLDMMQQDGVILTSPELMMMDRR
jgi:protease-4